MTNNTEGAIPQHGYDAAKEFTNNMNEFGFNRGIGGQKSAFLAGYQSCYRKLTEQFNFIDWRKGYVAGLEEGTKAPVLRWVKASERLPKYPGSPYNHYRLDEEHKVNGNFHYSIDDERCEGEIVFTVIGNGAHDDYQIPREKWSGLEWLEEVSYSDVVKEAAHYRRALEKASLYAKHDSLRLTKKAIAEALAAYPEDITAPEADNH